MEPEIKKPRKKFYYSLIFWLAIIIFVYFSVSYLITESKYKFAKSSQASQFSNIETEIYQTTKPVVAEELVKDGIEKKNDLLEQLLKQEQKISDLQNNYYALKADLERLKHQDNLPKIILTFVKLQDLIVAKENYDQELQRLELLCRLDFALSDKVSQLKIALQNHPKNKQEIITEFDNLIPKINSKEIELQTGDGFLSGWFGKIKAVLAKFIVVKRVGEPSNPSNVYLVINQTQKLIASGNYSQAIEMLYSLGSDYQEILLSIKNDLSKAAILKSINDDIYQYLILLSDNTISNS